MKKLSELKHIIIPVVALVAGLSIGLGIGYLQLQKEQKIFQNKIKESGKKIVLIQKKMSGEKDEATAFLGQQCRNDMDALQNEKKSLGAQLAGLKEQNRSLEAKIEAKIKEADELAVKSKRELQDAEKKNDLAAQRNKELERDLKKVKGEKDNFQAALKKNDRELKSCREDNAALSVIGEELVQAYKNKGITTAILEKEPLTQIKKVELEQLIQKYKDNIEQLKIKN